MQAAASVESHSESANHSYGPASQAFLNWSRLDSSASIDWLASQPKGRTSKHLLQQLANNLRNSPTDHFNQLLNLSSSLDGGEQIDTRLINAWINNAPKEAKAYFQSGQGTPAQQTLAREVFKIE